MAREAALIQKNPLLIQKTLADKLSDKIQVIIAPPQASGFFAGGLLGGRRDSRAGGDSRPRPRQRRGRVMLALALVAAAIVTQDATPLARRAEARRRRSRRCCGRATGSRCAASGRAGCRSTTTATSGRGTCGRRRCARFAVDETAARELRAVVDFLRDAPGAGVARHRATPRCSCAPRRRAPSAPRCSTRSARMAERLARRASSKWARPNDATLAGQLEVAESYGVKFRSFERDGRARVCYDGEAFRRVLALAGVARRRRRARRSR